MRARIREMLLGYEPKISAVSCGGQLGRSEHMAHGMNLRIGTSDQYLWIAALHCQARTQHREPALLLRDRLFAETQTAPDCSERWPTLRARCVRCAVEGTRCGWSITAPGCYLRSAARLVPTALAFDVVHVLQPSHNRTGPNHRIGIIADWDCTFRKTWAGQARP